jgi:hypothetical protein
MTTRHAQIARQTAATGQTGLLPSAGQVARAGASGAAIAGAWTGINETIRARNGEIETDEAVRTTVDSAAIGAAAGAVASVASHVARSLPPLGLALLALGVGALYISNARRPAAPAGDAEPAAPDGAGA